MLIVWFLSIKSSPNLLFGVLCLPGDQSHPFAQPTINPLACCICWAGLLGRAVFPPWNEGPDFGSYSRAEGPSAIGHGGEAAVSLEPDWWHRFWLLAGFNSIDALASRHSGLEIKMQHDCTLYIQYCTVKYTKAWPLGKDTLTWQCTQDTYTNMLLDTRATSHFWQFTTNLKVLWRGLAVLLFSSLWLLFSLYL